MKIREIKKVVKGQETYDGAGVKLIRVLGYDDVNDIDPFLMLDAFDSENPDDYIKGFPMHPHKGIETITYLLNGTIIHKDSLGNEGTIHDGESQWMTSGRGILHEEMPQLSKRNNGLQFWLNLSKKDKLVDPAYLDITGKKIGRYEDEDINISILSGDFEGKAKGIEAPYVKATVIDVFVKPKREFTFNVKEGDTLFIYVISGEGEVGLKKDKVFERSAVIFDDGDTFKINASNKGIRFMLCSGTPLNEDVAWAGPIVMNTQAELKEAFNDLNNGTFIKG